MSILNYKNPYYDLEEGELPDQIIPSSVQKEKVIRFGIILGISVLSILVLKVILKNKK